MSLFFRNKKRLKGKNEEKIRLGLESQMGDPITSFWFGYEGIVAGTALGRISGFIFTHKDDKNDNMSGLNEEKTHKKITNEVERDDSMSKSDVIVDFSEIEENNHKNKCSSDVRLDGRYVVYSSYSDDVVNSVYIRDNFLFSLIGTNSVIIYDIKNYTIHNEVVINRDLISSGSNSIYKGYKQLIQNNNLVLVIHNYIIFLINFDKIDTNLDKVDRQSSAITKLLYINDVSHDNIFLENILEFKFRRAITFNKSNNDLNIFIYNIELNSSNYVNQVNIVDTGGKIRLFKTFSLNKILGKKMHLVTTCRFYSENHDIVIIVTDLVLVILYNIETNTVLAKSKFKYDVLDVDSNDSIYILCKNSQVLVTDLNLNVKKKINIFSTFELGKSFTL